MKSLDCSVADSLDCDDINARLTIPTRRTEMRHGKEFCSASSLIKDIAPLVSQSLLKALKQKEKLFLRNLMTSVKTL